MGLFNDTNDNSRQDEVVIDAPAEDSSGETRLGQEVESSLIDDSKDDTGSESEEGLGSDISLKDVHRQNETIIDLLEQLVDSKDNSKKSNSGATGRAGSRNSSRVTDRSSNSSSRVTDREDSSDDESIGDGMNELL